MKKMINYNDFLFNLILENKNTIRFVISERLKILLKKSNHPIANKLLDLDKNEEETKITLIDLDDKNINNFTFVQSNKIIDKVLIDNNIVDDDKIQYVLTNQRSAIGNIIMKHNTYWEHNRSTIKMGKLVNKLFPNEYQQSGSPNNDIESFVNKMRFLRSNKFYNFKIVQGEDIKKYYLYQNYDSKSRNGSALGSSCMRHEECQDYIDFYVKNNIQMVIMFSDDEDDKIAGRAILWDIQFIDDEEVDRKYMDRIYTIYDYDVDNFKEYAIKNGWLYKNKQNMEQSEYICDPIDNTCERRTLRTTNNIKKTHYYPYMDTMKYFYPDNGYLTNNMSSVLDENVYKLESTNGKYELFGKEYVEYYDDWFHEDELIFVDDINEYRLPEDATYIESEHRWVTNEYADENYVYSEIMDEYVDRNDVVYISSMGDYVSYDYADNNFNYSEISSEYLTDDESVFSAYYDTYIKQDNAVKLITIDSDDDVYDYVLKDDINNYIQYFNDRKNKIENYSTLYDGFIKVNVPENENDFTKFKEVYKHKEWDKDKIFKWNGRYFYDKNGKLKDYLTGQKRLWEKKKY